MYLTCQTPVYNQEEVGNFQQQLQRTLGTCGADFMTVLVFMFLVVLPGGPEKGNFGEAVQDRKEPHKHQPRPAVWEQGEGMMQRTLLGNC